MKIIFTGRNNSFNRRYVQELSKDHEVLCCLFLEVNRFSWKGRLSKIRKRIKRYGLIKVIDELFFHAYSKFFLRSKHEKDLLNSKSEFFFSEEPMDCPSYDVTNIHDQKWIDFIKNQNPDIIFSICCNVIFKPKLYNIPKFGTFVLHEGLTPEYKGLHTPIWAMLNNEPEYLGYTLLKVSDKIDGGEVLTQEQYNLKEGEDLHTWSWVGHNALIEGLPNIRKKLSALEEKGTFEPLDISNRRASYYTWIGLSSFLQKKRSKKK